MKSKSKGIILKWKPPLTKKYYQFHLKNVTTISDIRQSLNGDFVGFLKTAGVNEGSLALLQRCDSASNLVLECSILKCFCQAECT